MKLFLPWVAGLLLLQLCAVAERPQDYVRAEIDGPVLSGEEAIGKAYVEPGFRLSLVAEEPQVINPVVMRFDERGRLWVVEMVGYMNNLRGTKEKEPIGRISVLEDNDRDGKAEKATVFLDKLVEPRALAFHKGGLLWADAAKLCHTEILDGLKPGKTIVVDPKYASGHSVEHKPNALLRAIDNWYYSAKSNKRYREIDGEWQIEEVEFRNQYGLGMDNHGRLYHGQQNTILRADVFPPGFFMRNPELNLRTGGLATKSNEIQDNCFNVKVSHQPVYPVRTSRDMRDGYLESPGPDIDETGMAIRCTSAVSHFFYRDTYFPANFNAFVPDPALHLLKVLTITRKNGIPHGQDVFPDREIIASPDTRFRPVDVQSGPDGTIYVADLYHGVLQHKAFMNAHLRAFVKKHKLEEPTDLGRIYRLTIDGKKPNAWQPFVDPTVDQLVAALDSPSPWARDAAQRLLVDRHPDGAAEKLTALLTRKATTLGRIHALWTLEGIGALTEAHVLDALGAGAGDEQLTIHATRVSWQLENTDTLLQALVAAGSEGFSEKAYYLTQRLARFDHPKAMAELMVASQKWSEQPYFTKVVLSGGGPHSATWIASLPEGKAKQQLSGLFNRSRITRKPKPKHHLAGDALASFKRGQEAYGKYCFSCHGQDGKGMKDMGPPLAGSDWVTGTPDVMAKIILKGMQGPITVSGKAYKPLIPMNAFDELMTDQEIADVMTFVRNHWGNRAGVVPTTLVTAARKQSQAVTGPYKPGDFRK